MRTTLRPFGKRTFTLPLLAQSTAAALHHGPALLRGLVQPATSPALREKVMLAVTAVNDCRYCSWAHTGLALENGVDLDALREILDHGSFGSVSTPEGVAILYAKHFADTVRRPSAEAERALAAAWPDPTQRAEILAYIHAIYFANLSGNSLDAWLARLRGQAVEQGHPVAEALAALASAPVLAAIRWRSRYSRPEQMAAL